MVHYCGDGNRHSLPTHVPSNSHLPFDCYGLFSCTSCYQLACSFGRGIEAASFTQSQISFTPNLAGEIAELTLLWAQDTNIIQNEQIVFLLPGFGPSVSVGSLSLGDASYSGAWDGTTETMTLTRLDELSVAAGTVNTVVVQSGSGITLPIDGIVSASHSLSIECAVCAEAISATPLATVPSALYVRNASAVVSNVFTGELSAITFTFQHTGEITAGDTITFTLTGSTCANANLQTFLSNDGNYLDFDTDVVYVSESIILRADATIAAETVVEVTFTEAAGIYLPNTSFQTVPIQISSVISSIPTPLRDLDSMPTLQGKDTLDNQRDIMFSLHVALFGSRM